MTIPPDLSALRMDDEARQPRRRPWRLIIGAVVLAILGIWLGPPLAERLRAPQVRTTTVQLVTSTQAQTVLTATGYTYARVRAAVGAKIIGRIVELPFDEGDAVRRGDIIAVLDSADLRAGLRQAEARVAEAQARLVDAEREEGRQRSLVQSGVAAQAALDAATTQLAVTRATVDTAQATADSVRAQLEYTVIRSPIDGVMIERNVEVGEMVAPGGFTSQQSTGAIARIADPGSLEIEADINESYIARIRPEQPASIKVDAVPDRLYTGRLRQIVPTADRQRAVVEVKVAIDDRDERLVPDMSCTVTFLEEGTDQQTLEQAPRSWLPVSAVVEADAGTYVWRVETKSNRLQKVFVTLGERRDGQVEVVAGASAGDVVLAEPKADLGDAESDAEGRLVKVPG